MKELSDRLNTIRQFALGAMMAMDAGQLDRCRSALELIAFESDLEPPSNSDAAFIEDVINGVDFDEVFDRR